MSWQKPVSWLNIIIRHRLQRKMHREVFFPSWRFSFRNQLHYKIMVVPCTFCIFGSVLYYINFVWVLYRLHCLSLHKSLVIIAQSYRISLKVFAMNYRLSSVFVPNAYSMTCLVSCILSSVWLFLLSVLHW